MILEIKKYPDSILKKKCEEIKKITPEIEKLGKDMVATMEKAEPAGVGLSGPQVGVLKRIIVVQTNKGPAVFVNPRILKKSKETEIIEEGCLSLPGIYIKVKRPRGVIVRALNIKGKTVDMKKKDLPARVFQHEIDHLDGVLILDKAGFFEKMKIKKSYVFNRRFNSKRLAENAGNNKGF